jgi:uncharacterized pyridoxamine 5'-phosphate oxidase family protein
MLSIPEKAKKLIIKEQVIIVGTSQKGIVNVSPRTSFHIDQNGMIYWLEIFKHKTFRNISKNHWCSIAVYDKKKLVGYQLKGKATFVTDRKIKSQLFRTIVDKLTRLHKQRILRQIKNRRPNIVQFSAKLVFSLNPNEFADSPLIVNANDESFKAADMQW